MTQAEGHCVSQTHPAAFLVKEFSISRHYFTFWTALKESGFFSASVVVI